VYALTFARQFRYNTSKLLSDGASAVTDWMRGIYRAGDSIGENTRFVFEGIRHATQQSGRLEGVSVWSRGAFRPDPFG
jgi:hypothetical protein